MKILKIYTLFILLFIFIGCSSKSNSSNIIIDKGILLNKTEFFGRFNSESYTFYILYKGHTYHPDVDKEVYKEYNVKDSVEFTVINFGNGESVIDIVLPKN